MTPDGCSAGQELGRLCDPQSFERHGHYVSCVSHVSGQLVDRGLRSLEERACIVAQAARSK